MLKRFRGVWSVLAVCLCLPAFGGSARAVSGSLLPSPDPTPQITIHSNNTQAAIVDPGTITSTIVVSGVDTMLKDVDVTTFIRHTASADLDITLTSPAGTTVMLTTDNGGSFDDVFNGTVWNDLSLIHI